MPAIEVLHKKAVVLSPGSFEHVDPTHGAIHERMLASAVQQLRRELGEKALAPIGLFCLSAMPLTATDPPSGIPGLLKRIDARLGRGGYVLLFGGRELYNMTALVNRYTTEHVRFVVGLSFLNASSNIATLNSPAVCSRLCLASWLKTSASTLIR